ncbi:tyrosine-type recombinase/integrase, partial [Pseudomonadota bacterium]
DREAMSALGESGARTRLREVIEAYRQDWAGRDTSRPGQLTWWSARLGERFISDITAEDVRLALNDFAGGLALRWDGIASGGRSKFTSRGTPRRPATVNRMKAALSSLFKWAIEEGIAHRNPAREVRARPENNKRLRYLSEEELLRLQDACRKSDWDRLYLLVLMALMTGARQGELLNLRWEHIDFTQRTAMLEKTKNGDRRALTLPYPVVEELMRYRMPDGLLFPGLKRRDKPRNFKRHWLAALQAADIQNFRFHDLRHTAASYLAMNGATLLEIGEVLGHRNLETTRRYAHLSIDHK